MAVIRSLCGQCGVGCGIRAVTGEGREALIEGDPVHPANGGLLCTRSEALKDMFPLDGRLLRPMVDGRAAGWDRAIDQAARRLSAVIARHGPGSVAMHVPGGLLTEDYYVANKLIKGFVGSAHVEAPCSDAGGMAAAQRAAFGEDVTPAVYEDLAQADMLLLLGVPTARRHPVLHERLAEARAEQGARLILVAHADDGQEVEADERLNVAPGSEAMLLNGLLLHCHDHGALDRKFMERSLSVPADFWAGLRRGHDLWSVARACGLAPGEVRAFYDQVAAAPRLVTLFSPQGQGEEARRLSAAILNFHLATGRIGKAGAAPFAVTDAGNGMGAREVGCRAGELAAHRDFSVQALAEVGRFWGAARLADRPGMSGAALARAVEAGHVKALLMMGGLPSASHPIRSLMGQVPLVIATTPWSEPEIESLRMVALPSPLWVEKDGTLTGADRLISRQRRLFPLPGEAKPDWWIFTRIAQAMGWREAFHYERPAEIYREHVRLTAYRNEGGRLLNLKRHAPISNPAYDELTPWRWGEVPFDEGRFPTPDGKARLIAL
ncbi:NagC family transcriptional regulator [Sphingobium indicum]|uniref:NagC family transcriptional regulator n=2 Tax=Sphingobium indicum TaxID=332055 RepID=A0A1L5BRK3_SPHIB|nr:molybdopterin-dependent oxidoreductase [Sphingobium indicum]APL95432.1 NagC family transcriptional regulator [Sphingobium indicum B90A]KEY99916.1 NagC family transcriptional regulator [Sphingomonas sp. BHC-A]NYI22542.1 assimilatory nitrate reductase catalytic subunit [Sphingobium indicum]RYM02473.1 NagC family transcriptional regulator [Sphingobium indicum]